MRSPLIAIIGRPNVGKSTLFNRLTGSRKAIVGDEPGITRDRIFGRVDWRSKTFELVDTGGIVPDEEAIIPSNIFKQAGFAIDRAEAIIWVVDTRAGVTPLDEEIAVYLRNTGKAVFIAANKADGPRAEAESSEFFRFGFDVTPVSAEHGISVGDLLDKVFEIIYESGGIFDHDVEKYDDGKDADNERSEDTVSETHPIRLAIIGRPNVGKSSLVNTLLGEERVIVTPIAGTTRDAVDTQFVSEGRVFELIDTAGIRRKGKTTEMAEKLSVVMARKALARADVAILVIDAVEGVTNLDASIAGYAVEAGCSVIIVVNKWDAVVEKGTNTIYEFERSIRKQIKFLDWAPIIPISALTGQRVNRLTQMAVMASEARNQRVATSRLNKFFEENIRQPKGGTAPSPVRGGTSRLKVQYITQGGVRPPLFILFTSGGNRAELHFSYLRYIENRLRSEFGFYATPLRLKQKHKAAKKNDLRKG